MIEKLAQIESSVFNFGVIIITFLGIFFAWSLTTEFYETPKFLLLTMFIILMLLLSTFKYITTGKVVLNITPLDLPFIIIIIISAISTFTSSSPYISILGNASRIHGSLISLIIYALLYFLLVNNLKHIKDIKPALLTLAVGGVILSIQAILSYFGVKLLPINWTQVQNFTPTGSSFSTSAILVLILPFILTAFFRTKDPSLKIVYILILTLFGITLTLIGSWIILTASIIAITISFLSSKKHMHPQHGGLLILVVPLVIILLIGVLSFVKLPEKSGKLYNNVFYKSAQSFPREIQLPFDTSWSVSVSAFRDSPFWGTGPSSFLFNFTTYKPVSFNRTNLWNIRFDQPFNEYFNFLASVGAIGLVSFLILTALIVSLSTKVLSQEASDTQSESSDMKTSLAISSILLFVLLFLHVSTLTLVVVGILILASFFALNPQFCKTIHIKLGGDTSFDILPLILLVIMLALAASGYFFIGKYAWADVHHRNALSQVASGNAVETYNELVKAEQLNPYSDLYRTDLANTNFAIANAIATSKGPTESSPGGSLTDQDKQNIQQLLSQAITEGRNAITISPKSANNWEVLGNIYRQMSGVAQNALQFSLDSYGRAIIQDPLNPSLRLTVGGIYYSIKNYEMAVRFFTDSVNIKPDFANGYFNLSVALRDKGDLVNAQAVAEKLVSIIDPKSSDYKTAVDYLKDLKDRIATGSADQSQIVPPASQQTSTLEQKTLPKVLDLPKPSSIASPAAIKKQE